MSATPVLALRGVSKRFGAVQALTDVELEVHPGEVVALVGDNGAGKSTLVKAIAGVGPADEGTVEWNGEPVRIDRPHDAQELGIATVYQDLALCDNLDVVGNLFLGNEIKPRGILDEVEMERRARELLSTLSIRIPSVRVPVASLSGGQRQTVAIARSLLGEPRVVILDEPTAALGVEQTAQVLDLVERLRERDLGVLLISHNMADVRAVSDRVAVLRLGRNNGTYTVSETTQEEIVSAITGATDNVVTRRDAPVPPRTRARRRCSSDHRHPHERHAGRRRARGHGEGPGGRGERSAGPAAAEVSTVDPRLLVRQQGFSGYLDVLLRRLRTGELGSVPVVIGLLVIGVVFQLQDSAFLSANNLSNLFVQSAGTGLIAVGIVFVLILGEIDLSVGSVSGMAAAVLAVLNINHGMNEVLAVLLAILTGMAAGAVHGFFFARIGVPAFVVTLAGLLGWNGLMLQILGPSGTINLDGDGVVAHLTNYYFADKAAAAMGLATVCVLAFLAFSLLDARRRKAAEVPSRPLSEILLRTVILAVPAYAAAAVFNSYRGLPLAVVIFLGMVVLGDFVLRRTGYGRKVFAVGGSSEAAGRAGINVPLIRITVYAIAGTMAAVGGLFFASQINAANQSSGAGSLLMNCIAAAVIGGTSLFGGRGKTWSALLGALVIQSINSGMALLGTGSALRDMITGAVLLAAVVIDSVSRRTQKTAGRA